MSDLEAKEITIKVPNAPVAMEYDLGEDKPAKQEQPTQSPAKDDEAVEVLRSQLAQKQREAEEARRQKIEAERVAHERAAEVKNYQVQAEDNKLTAFVNAIASFERDAEMLERDYANTLAEGDYNKAAKLQRQMSQVESRLIQLQQGREALQEKLQYEKQVLENQRRQPQPQIEQQPVDPVEAHIAKLSPPSQQWLRGHREVLTNPQLNARMTAAHYDAVAENIQPDSPQYFEYIESRLGYGQKQASAPQATQKPRMTMAAAPVSRSNSAQNLRSGNTVQYTLTPAQREMARELDMSDEEYLEGMIYQANKGKLDI